MQNLINPNAVDLVKSFEDSVSSMTSSLNKIATDPDTKFGTKIDYILTSSIALVPILLNELNPDNKLIDKDRAEHVMRVNSLLTSIQSSMYKKREMEAKEEVDISHPKFQKAMEFMVEVALLSMDDIGVDKGIQSSFIHDFSMKMVGFEDIVNKKLKGISFQDLDTVDNPLVRLFNEERKVTKEQ